MREIRHLMVTAEDYAEFLRVCVDGDTMSPDYAVFAQCVEDFCEGVRAQGGVPIKVYIKPGDLVAWCRSVGRQVDASGRENYAASRDLSRQN